MARKGITSLSVVFGCTPTTRNLLFFRWSLYVATCALPFPVVCDGPGDDPFEKYVELLREVALEFTYRLSSMYRRLLVNMPQSNVIE